MLDAEKEAHLPFSTTLAWSLHLLPAGATGIRISISVPPTRLLADKPEGLVVFIRKLT